MGRRVRCTNCGYVWHLTQIVSIDKSTSVSSPKKDTTYKINTALKYYTFILWIGLIFILSDFFKHALPLSLQLRPFGIYDTSFTEIRDVHVSIKEDRLFIKGKIYNNSYRRKFLPQVRLTFYDKKNNEVDVHNITVSSYILQKKEDYKIFYDTPYQSQIDHLIIDIGDKLDLLLRK